MRRDAVKRRGVALAAGAGEKLVQWFPQLEVFPGAIVAGYIPIGSEIDPTPLMRELHSNGATICLPRVNIQNNSLDFLAYQFGDVLETSSFGVQEPLETRKKLSPDWLLVPLLAFDKNCSRLGYGKGYYDKAIADLKKGGAMTFGLAFATQEFDNIPVEPHDEVLDYIVCEIACYQNIQSQENSLEKS